MRRLALLMMTALLALGSGAVANPDPVPTFYVGFEDREARDYDYNDFGMLMSVRETRDDLDRLVALELNLEARCHVGWDVHDIHLTRRFGPETGYAYAVDRTRPAEGTETPESAGYGSGDLDVVLFDSAVCVPGDLVRIVIRLDEPLREAPFDPSASPYDAEGCWARYEPWLYDRTVDATRRLRDEQQFRVSEVELPYVLVIPAETFEPPPEDTPVMDVYPDFVEFFATGEARLSRWFAR